MIILRRKMITQTIAAAIVASLSTGVAAANPDWSEMKSQGFIEALNELGIDYDNLTNSKYANVYDASDVNSPLFWLSRTFSIYKDAKYNEYHIPISEAKSSRTTGFSRSPYFLTYTWGKKDEIIKITTGNIPDNVVCHAATDPNYQSPNNYVNIQKIAANTTLNYVMTKDAMVNIGCEDQDSDMANADTLVKFELSGGSYHPLFIFGLDSANSWATEAKSATPSGYTFLFDGRTEHVVSNTKAKNSANNNILRYLSESLLRVNLYDQINGLDGSSWLHQPRRGLLVAYYEKCCYASAGRGVTAIGFKNFIPSVSGWGEWHEYGHQNQIGWSWGGMAEVSVNMYTLAACRETLGEVDVKQCHHNPHFTGFTWDQQAIGTLLQSGETRNFTTTDGATQTRFFAELMTAWPTLYPALGKAYREVNRNDPKSVDSTQEKIDWFTLNASKAAGVNLNSYFAQWGIPLSSTAVDAINALALPQPKKNLRTYTAELTATTPATLAIRDDDGAKNIGFLATTAEAGPTKLAWSSSGQSLLQAQVIDSSNRTFMVTLRGTVGHGACANMRINSTQSCQSRSSTFLKVSYSAADNPLLPAGSYTGVLHLIANDWHKKEWAANTNINISITK